MARPRQYNRRAHYFSPRLREKLRRIPQTKSTVVEAPSGFGKTTAIEDFLRTELPENVRVLHFIFWDESASGGWRRFCRTLSLIGQETGDTLLQLGLPDEDTQGEAAALMWNLECREETYLVIDDFHQIAPFVPLTVWKALLQRKESGLHLILLLQPCRTLNLPTCGRQDILSIDSEDLRLEPEEVGEYFREVGVSLTALQQQEAFRQTGGWMAALYLQMLHFLDSGNFSFVRGIHTLLRETVWNRLSEEQRDGLLQLCPFDSFNMRQAIFITGKTSPAESSGEVSFDNAFIRYDPQERRYYPHHILLEFIREIFENLPAGRRRQILYRAGDWCAENKRIMEAFNFYYRLGDFEKLLALDLMGLTAAQEESEGYIGAILEIIEKCPAETKTRFPDSMLKLAFELFGAGCYEKFGQVCQELKTSIEHPDLPAKERNRLLGNLILLSSFGEYNDIEKMSAGHREAHRLIQGKTTIIDINDPWTFDNASVLFMYHSKPGELEKELCHMEKCLPYYLELTGGHGSGADLLMRAEAYFFQGKTSRAEMPAYKARHTAQSERQHTVSLCAGLLLARIALFRGDGGEFSSSLRHMEHLLRENPQKPNRMTGDLAFSFLMILLHCPDQAALWLRQGEINNRRLLEPAFPFAQVVYSAYLLQKGQEKTLLALSEEFLETAGALNCITAEIYLNIYRAAAYRRKLMQEEARLSLRKALTLAEPDSLFMPFAENFAFIDSLLSECGSHSFYRKTASLAARHEKGRKTVLRTLYHNVFLKELTGRELETAKLAARGFSNKEIGGQLNISENTVKKHLKIVFQKLNVSNRTALAAVMK